jgi:hypothetical protein
MEINKTLEEMVEFIVAEVGVPLPTYGYEYKAYITSLPMNVKLEEVVIGVTAADTHPTFKDACISIIKWHLNQSNANNETE